MDSKFQFQLHVVFVLLLGAVNADLSSEYQNKATLDSKYTVHWTYNASDAVMYMATETQTTGWVAFGFTKEKSTHMEKYDVAIGMVSGGNGQIKHRGPTHDGVCVTYIGNV